MSKLLIVAQDRRLFDEIREILGTDGLELVEPRDVGIDVPDGEGTTFQQDAMDIADRVARASDLVTIVESSGIEVDALDGAPGVSSDRYAGTNATDAQNRAELLEDVDHATDAQSRSARMISVIGVASPDGRLEAFENTLEGVIADEERGVEGVGYEPIFELDDGMTIAELLPEAREDVHPRMVALASAQPFIRTLLDEQDTQQ